MRILMVSYGYPPVIGGVEQHVRNLSIALATRGHEVAVATLSHEGLPDYEVDEGVRVYRIRGTVHRLSEFIFKVRGRVYAPPMPDPELVNALRNIVKKERPQIVHAHNWLVHSFLPLKGWSGAKLIETLHSFGLVCIRWNLLYQNKTICDGPAFLKCLRCAQDRYGIKTLPTLLSRWATLSWERRAVDRFVPVSPAVAKGCGLTDGKWPYEVVPNFVPDDVASRQDETASCLDDLPGGEFLLFVGSLTTIKGIYVLLEAFRGLSDPPPLVLIGAPWPDTPTEFPPNVTVLHNWSHAAVMAAWARCTIGLIPSVCLDSSPTVTVEAMSLGRPVIGSRIGGITEQIEDGKTGLLVPPGDPVALREAIERLLADPDLRARMGRAAQEKVVEFQASTVVTRLEQLYEEVRNA